VPITDCGGTDATVMCVFGS